MNVFSVIVASKPTQIVSLTNLKYCIYLLTTFAQCVRLFFVFYRSLEEADDDKDLSKGSTALNVKGQQSNDNIHGDGTEADNATNLAPGPSRYVQNLKKLKKVVKMCTIIIVYNNSVVIIVKNYFSLLMCSLKLYLFKTNPNSTTNLF